MKHLSKLRVQDLCRGRARKFPGPQCYFRKETYALLFLKERSHNILGYFDHRQITVNLKKT